MKYIAIIIVFSSMCLSLQAQDLKNFKLYDPAENAADGLAKATQAAKAAGKHVFVQIGGNWCIWCARFQNMTTTDKSIDSLINANYVVYHMNYSEENKNEALLAKYGYPQRFGFPVFLVLDAVQGKLLHTQNSSYLEEGKGYSRSNVMGFFNDWKPAALDPKHYVEKK